MRMSWKKVCGVDYWSQQSVHWRDSVFNSATPLPPGDLWSTLSGHNSSTPSAALTAVSPPEPHPHRRIRCPAQVSGRLRLSLGPRHCELHKRESIKVHLNFIDSAGTFISPPNRSSFYAIWGFAMITTMIQHTPKSSQVCAKDRGAIGGPNQLFTYPLFIASQRRRNIWL